MKSLGEILAKASTAQSDKKALWAASVRASEDELRRPRRWKVLLCCEIFSEVEILGDGGLVEPGIARLAEAAADRARVYLHTAPGAFRYYVEKLSEPKNPQSPLQWVEVVNEPIDPLDPASPRAWQIGKREKR